MRKPNHIPDPTPFASAPALFFVLANPFLLIVVIAVLAMNAEWKATGKSKTQHAILGAVVTLLGCIPFIAVNKMPLGVFGAFILMALQAPFSYAMGKDTQEDETRATEPNPDKSRPFKRKTTEIVRQPQAEIWVDGRWVSLDELE